MKLPSLLFAAIVLSALASCSNTGSSAGEITESNFTRLDPARFRTVIDSVATDLFILSNDSMEVAITNYGARVASLLVRGADDEMIEVVVGADSLADYRKTTADLRGAVVGRYAGVLKDNKAQFGDRTLQLNSLRRIWAHRPWEVVETTDSTVKMRLVSPEGEGGMPGMVAVQAEYRLHRHNGLTLNLTAITDSPTPIDIAHSLSVNLDGSQSTPLTKASNHQMQLFTNQFLWVDSLSNITGDMLMTIWTPLDFRKARTLKNALNGTYDVIRQHGGMDLYFVKPDYGTSGVTPAVRLISKTTGLQMDVASTLPGVGVKVLRGDTDITVTSSDYPDAPNHKGWGHPTTITPSSVLSHTITYTFRHTPAKAD